VSIGAITALRLCASCAGGFVILLAFGEQTVWLAQGLAIVGLPFILFFALVSFKFVESIKYYPIRWAATAIFLAGTLGFFIFGLIGLIFSLFLSFPSAVLFILWNLLLPIKVGNDLD
jgi:hypothetical protein